LPFFAHWHRRVHTDSCLITLITSQAAR